MTEIVVTCDCGAPMQERLNTISNTLFLGCSNYPRCRKTRAIPAALEVRAAGGQELPGLFDEEASA